MNLLQETIEDIRNSGHVIEDIIFIGSEESGHSSNWEEFKRLADQEYDNDFGAQKVAIDLIIVFKDGMKMWREEYDGSEKWTYSDPFEMPHIRKVINRLIVKKGNIGWQTLEEINKDE